RRKVCPHTRASRLDTSALAGRTRQRPEEPPTPVSRCASSFIHLLIEAFENRACRERPAAFTTFGELAQRLFHRLQRPDFLLDVRDLCFCPHPHVRLLCPRLHSQCQQLGNLV